MFSELLLNLYHPNHEIRINAEKMIIEIRDTNQNTYYDEIKKILSLSEVDTRILHAAIVLLGQSIHMNSNDSFNPHFFEELSTLILPKIDPFRSNIAHTASILLGEVLGYLVRDKCHPHIIQHLIDLFNNAPNNDFIHYYLITLKTLLESSDLEKTHSTIVFNLLLHLFQNPETADDALETICAMTEEIQEAATEESKQFFIQQLLERTNQTEHKKSCYKCWTKLMKNAFNFILPCSNIIMKIAFNDISVSNDHEILIESILFLKSIIKYQKRTQTQIINFTFFDELLIPLIRVFSLIENENILDANESQNPHLVAQDTLSLLISIFSDHSSKVIIPIIISFSQQNSITALELSLFFLSMIIIYSTNIPSNEDILNLICNTLNHQNVRIRFSSIRTLNVFLKRIKNEIEEIFFALNAFPLLMNLFSANDHPIILRKAVHSLTRLAVFETIPINNVYHLFFSIINTHTDELVVSDTMNCFPKIIKKRNMNENMLIIEPTIQLLNAPLISPRLSTFFEEIQCIFTTLIDEVTIAALDYLPVAFSFLIQYENPCILLGLAEMAKVFGQDYIQENYIQTTIELLFGFITCNFSDSDSMFYCCCAITIFSKMPWFQPFVQKTTELLFNVFESHNLIAIVGLSAIYDNYYQYLIPFNTKFIEVATQAFLEVVKGEENQDEEIIIGCIEIVQTCYENTQKPEILNVIFNILNEIVLMEEPSPNVIFNTINMIKTVDVELLQDLNQNSNIISNLMTLAREYDLEDIFDDFLSVFNNI
ncbi:hypothetical protein TRFO_30778 [Tritrichomonas foetus]|uniref:Importin N-terminal domain-containing protein n=1 Tax=Tritrichomonas foetus TaxID=1144522 RepID=A0A1J4JSX0_9EUKA|nr:hypothetical protein TRFO_30778 [Tritrichomonas foetus]|eukprot:OHT02209.1 hypothetical protein TRFO_30778 [Tritrichomonas foetus]